MGRLIESAPFNTAIDGGPFLPNQPRSRTRARRTGALVLAGFLAAGCSSPDAQTPGQSTTAVSTQRTDTLSTTSASDRATMIPSTSSLSTSETLPTSPTSPETSTATETAANEEAQRIFEGVAAMIRTRYANRTSMEGLNPHFSKKQNAYIVDIRKGKEVLDKGRKTQVLEFKTKFGDSAPAETSYGELPIMPDLSELTSLSIENQRRGQPDMFQPESAHNDYLTEAIYAEKITKDDGSTYWKITIKKRESTKETGDMKDGTYDDKTDPTVYREVLKEVRRYTVRELRFDTFPTPDTTKTAATTAIPLS